MPPSLLERHVSFASPPVDVTIPAASYPSSPESTRSPPPHYGQIIAPFTPDYQTALQSDPFDALGQHTQEDHSIRHAFQNAQNKTIVEQSRWSTAQEGAVRDTLNRFASAPRPDPTPAQTGDGSASARHSLDVDAFTRLLLTGDSIQATPATPTSSMSRSGTRVLSDTSSGTDTASLSQNSMFDANLPSTNETPRSSHEQDREDITKHIPPPAPAPRRGKSVKSNDGPPTGNANKINTIRKAQEVDQTTAITSTELPKRAPTPPLARRHSQRAASTKSEETTVSPSPSPAEPTSSSPSGTPRPSTRHPPPPPSSRRQSSYAERRPSHDLAPTIEEPETDSHPTDPSRRSSDTRPPPVPSRNSSISIKRSSQGFMSPPPLPPPRRARGSSNSSINSFRPSLATLTGDDTSQDQPRPSSTESLQRDDTETSTRTFSSANSILIDLAALQKEVDAARRGA